MGARPPSLPLIPPPVADRLVPPGPSGIPRAVWVAAYLKEAAALPLSLLSVLFPPAVTPPVNAWLPPPPHWSPASPGWNAASLKAARPRPGYDKLVALGWSFAPQLPAPRLPSPSEGLHTGRRPAPALPEPHVDIRNGKRVVPRQRPNCALNLEVTSGRSYCYNVSHPLGACPFGAETDPSRYPRGFLGIGRRIPPEHRQRASYQRQLALSKLGLCPPPPPPHIQASSAVRF